MPRLLSRYAEQINSEEKDMVQSEKSSGVRTRLTLLSTVGLALLLTAAGFYFARRSGNNPHVYSNDFNVYYFASLEVVAGRDPYQNSLGEWTPYLYPPLLAELLIPLTLITLQPAAFVWFLIGASSVIGAARLSAGLALKPENEGAEETAGRRTLIPAALSVAIVARFALDNFDYGQVNTLVAALCVAHVFLYERNRKFSAAIALALAASFKLTPLILVVYHLSKLRVKFAAGVAGLFLSITALSFAPFGARAPDALNTFLHKTVNNEQGFNLADPGNQSLRGAVARLRGDSGESATRPREPITLAVSLAMLAVSALTAMRKSRSWSPIASLFCCIPLLSPLAWKGHFVLLIFPAAVLISEAYSMTSAKVRRVLVVVLAAVFAVFNLTSSKVAGLAASEFVDRHSLIFAGALLVYAATIWSAWQPSGAGGDDNPRGV